MVVSTFKLSDDDNDKRISVESSNEKGRSTQNTNNAVKK